MNGNAQEKLQQIAIGQIAESTTNPRKSFTGMEELKASIAESGIHVPLLVRVAAVRVSLGDSESAAYELVCGARRLRAARELKLETVPCIVRAMDDADAYQVQVIENLQRAGIHPLEEADAFHELRGKLGTIAAVAQAASKEQAYVAKCLQLRSLTEMSKKSLLADLITIEHALLLARLADREQNAALKWTLDRNAGAKTPVEKVVEDRLARRKEEGGEKKQFHHYAGWEPESVKQLKAHIENESGVDLKRAPWKLDDADLVPAAGPCSTCEKNTKANTPLFGDLAIGESRCTDGACWGDKTAAFVRIQMRTADGVNKPVRLSWKPTSVKPAMVFLGDVTAPDRHESANPEKVLKYGQWIDAKPKSCTRVRTGVTVDWSDAGERGYMGRGQKVRKPGETLTVCIAAGCKVHPKAWEKQAARPKSEKLDPAAEADKRRREEAEQKCVFEAESKIRRKIVGAILGKLTVASAVRLAADDCHEAPQLRKMILEMVPGVGGELLEALTIVASGLSREMHPSAYWIVREGAAKDRKDLWDLAKRAGVDANAIAAKHFHDAGSIAPANDRLYPKGIPWPKRAKDEAPAKAAKNGKKPSARLRQAASAKALMAKAKKKGGRK